MSVVTEETIMELAQARSTALIHKDRETLDRLLAPTFRYTNADGIVLTKAEYFEHYVDSPLLQWVAQTMDEIVVALYQDTAVLSCRVHDQARYGEQSFDDYYRSTFVWVSEHGEWHCVAGHTTVATKAQENTCS